MISLPLKEAGREQEEVLSALKLVTLAESLGGYESLAELPSMTHASLSRSRGSPLASRRTSFRISVSLENAADIIADTPGLSKPP